MGAVIFDMDGVLVDSARAHAESWRLLAAELGTTLTNEQFVGQFGRTSRDIIRHFFGAHLSDEVVARYDARKEQVFRELIRGRVPVMPGALELIHLLHDAGFGLALGSSGPPQNIALCLDELGLRSRFGAVVSGMDVTEGKPHPQVFLLAAKRLGVEPTSCVVIEDAPAGVEAARRACMKAVALTSTHPAGMFEGADLVVDSLKEVTPELIGSLLAAGPNRVPGEP
jgi:beta-phosphoglucomutase